MKEQSFLMDAMTAPGIVPVIRLNSGEKLPYLLEAFQKAGIRAVELTMTMPDAPGLLQKNRQRFGDDLVIGMGTVVNEETAQQALDHGAQFLVSPFPVPAALPLAKAQAIPMVMGAFSPLEVFTVYHLGADFVKVFPLNVLGMNYLKDLKGPLPGVKFFPTGGITLEQIPALFKLGVAGCGVGGSLVRTDLIAENNWEELYSLARRFLEAIPERSQSK
jgi:2-dehydro-3-deoxyphosphogluconate aldolase/(4S)-4-hydroxy-2-oxoglutarate aldolase